MFHFTHSLRDITYDICHIYKPNLFDRNNREDTEVELERVLETENSARHVVAENIYRLAMDPDITEAETRIILTELKISWESWLDHPATPNDIVGFAVNRLKEDVMSDWAERAAKRWFMRM